MGRGFANFKYDLVIKIVEMVKISDISFLDEMTKLVYQF